MIKLKTSRNEIVVAKLPLILRVTSTRHISKKQLSEGCDIIEALASTNSNASAEMRERSSIVVHHPCAHVCVVDSLCRRFERIIREFR